MFGYDWFSQMADPAFSVYIDHGILWIRDLLRLKLYRIVIGIFLKIGWIKMRGLFCRAENIHIN